MRYGGYQNVCWAVCEVFVKNFDNVNITKDEFNKQVSEMVERTNKYNGNTVNFIPGSIKNFPKYDTIVSMLDESNGPIYGSIIGQRTQNYANDLDHAIVIVGAYSYKNEKYVCYYDPNSGMHTSKYDEETKMLGNEKLVSISKVDKENYD